MRQDQFTTRFQELLGEAQSMAVERSQQYIDPLHLLLAVLKDTEGTGRTVSYTHLTLPTTPYV